MAKIAAQYLRVGPNVISNDRRENWRLDRAHVRVALSFKERKRILLALKSGRSLRFMSVAHDKMKVRSKLLWKSVKWERDEALCVTLKWSAGYGH